VMHEIKKKKKKRKNKVLIVFLIDSVSEHYSIFLVSHILSTNW